MDWQIIGSVHQLTQRREIFGRKEIGQEVKIHSQQEKKKEIRGNFKTSEGTQFDCVGVRTHISMYILEIYFAICCCTYINVY